MLTAGDTYSNGPKSEVVQDAKSLSALVEDHLTFERMLADLSARFANVPAEQVETEIKEAQMMLQQFLDVDRSCLSEFQEDGSLVVLSSTAVDGVDPLHDPAVGEHEVHLLPGRSRSH